MHPVENPLVRGYMISTKKTLADHSRAPCREDLELMLLQDLSSLLSELDHSRRLLQSRATIVEPSIYLECYDLMQENDEQILVGLFLSSFPPADSIVIE